MILLARVSSKILHENFLYFAITLLEENRLKYESIHV